VAGCVRRPRSIPGLPPGFEAQLAHLGCRAAVGGDGCAAQVVAEQEGDCAAFPHGHALPAGVVILDHGACAAGPLIIIPDVDRRCAPDRRLDALAIAVV